jgi:regulatory protein
MSNGPSIFPGSEGSHHRGRRPPPRISRADFERAALRHLERYPSSAAGLRTVLKRRTERSHAHHGEGLQEAEGIIDEVIARMVALGFLDDQRYGRALARRLRARGSSLRRIAVRLHAKGIASEVRASLLAEVGGPEAELVAARTYARRRGLGTHRRDDGRGPFRPADAGAAAPADGVGPRRQRELAALGRAGFDFEIAQRALDDE